MPQEDPQRGAIEMFIHWQSKTDLTRDPRLEIVAVPLDVNDGNALYIRGNSIEIQIKNKYVQDSDFDYAVFGPCTGYLTVSGGYISKQQEPDSQFQSTFSIDWCSVYIVDESRSTFKIRARATTPIGLGEDVKYFWGRFG